MPIVGMGTGVFRDSGLSYSLVASSQQWWDACEWWHDEKSGSVVIMEYIKLAYYLDLRG